jgi:hypothetical protein
MVLSYPDSPEIHGRTILSHTDSPACAARTGRPHPPAPRAAARTVLSVVLPRLSVDPRGGVSFQREVRFTQSIDIVDMLQKRGESFIPFPSCDLPYTLEGTRHIAPALCPGCVALELVPLGSLPSLPRLRGHCSSWSEGLGPRTEHEPVTGESESGLTRWANDD